MAEWPLPSIDTNLCDGCGLCVTLCPTAAVDLVEERPIIARPNDCAYCGVCEEICPEDAISLAYEIVPESPEGDQDA